MEVPPGASGRIRRFVRAVRRHPAAMVRIPLLLAVVAHRLRRRGYGETLRWIDAGVQRRSTGPGSDGYATGLELALLVRLVARVVPDATCLRRALVLRRLLADAGVPSSIRLGARPGPDGSLGFHAWVTVAGRVVSESERLIAGYVELDAGQLPLDMASDRKR